MRFGAICVLVVVLAACGDSGAPPRTTSPAAPVPSAPAGVAGFDPAVVGSFRAGKEPCGLAIDDGGGVWVTLYAE